MEVPGDLPGAWAVGRQRAAILEAAVGGRWSQTVEERPVRGLVPSLSAPWSRDHMEVAGAGSQSGQVPLKAPTRADQFLGHALATATSLDSVIAEPVDPRLTVSFQPPLTGQRG